MVGHAQWKLSRDRNAESAGTKHRRREIRLAFDLGQAVYDRRKALGISQTELARLAGMTQPQVSKLELGGTVPTLPLLDRLAEALGASLNLKLDGEASTIEFKAHTAV